MKFRTVWVAVLAVATLGVTAEVTTPAQAATKVLQTKKMKKVAYKISNGYFYRNTKLTKRTHKASKYAKVNFYTYKSAKIRKSNGKKVTYYYVKNKSGKVKGWVWRGNLRKQPTYTRQKKDIVAMKRIVQGMSPDVQKGALGLFAHMNYKVAYHDGASNRDLYNVIFQMEQGADYDNSTDIQGIIKTYKLFKGRLADEKVEALNDYNDVDDVLKGRSDADLSDVAGNLVEDILFTVENMDNQGSK
ncbi:hypothetical protein ACFQ44_00620 [Levilactobacillus lanxiensis]|uniref:D-alanyl-D-alanine carboxypeptidase n=1 Tax=Levilactobacillus lanxiensis TaxID=2799568 RepID=A0ABW4D228_9LACO|nr:hypothetical protein [Levilactobacillus lanxiensis]